MTWVKTQPELPNRMAGDDLSEAAALAHFCALSWLSGTERFDCLIPRRLLPAVLPLTQNPDAAAAELVRAGYWAESDPRHLEVIEHAGYLRQSLITVDKKRASDAKSARRYREKTGTELAPSVTDAVTDSVAEPTAESAERLPTYLPKPRTGPPTEAGGTCSHCGQASGFLDGGRCRRDECRATGKDHT